MQEREARLLNESNDLKTVIIESAGQGSDWTIKLVDNNNNEKFLVSKRSTEPRLFKTSDAALRCCMRIGFHQVEVKL